MGNFGKCGGGGRRSAARVPAPLFARLTTISRSYSGVLVNLSSSGARIAADDLPDEGEEVEFRVDQTVIFGTARWRLNGECGIAFDGDLDGEEVSRIIARANEGGGKMTFDERAAFEDWNSGFAH